MKSNTVISGACISRSYSKHLFSLGSMLLIPGPLSTGLRSAWLSHLVSMHRCTVPIGLGSMTKLLHQTTVLSTDI